MSSTIIITLATFCSCRWGMASQSKTKRDVRYLNWILLFHLQILSRKKQFIVGSYHAFVWNFRGRRSFINFCRIIRFAALPRRAQRFHRRRMAGVLDGFSRNRLLKRGGSAGHGNSFSSGYCHIFRHGDSCLSKYEHGTKDEFHKALGLFVIILDYSLPWTRF